MRQELQAQRTQVLSLHVAFTDTDMARGAPGPKASPDDVVRQAVAALETGQPELLADHMTRSVHTGLTTQPPMYLGIRPSRPIDGPAAQGTRGQVKSHRRAPMFVTAIGPTPDLPQRPSVAQIVTTPTFRFTFESDWRSAPMVTAQRA